MTRPAPPPWMWLALSAATVIAVAGGLLLPLDSGAWRFTLVVLASIAAGSALAALIGRLLSRSWLSVVEDELLPAGLTLAVLLLLAVPLLPADGAPVAAPFEGWSDRQAIWFDDIAIAIRLVALAIATLMLSFAMLPGAAHRSRVAMFGTPVLTALLTLAVLDWVVLRPPVWWTALLPIAYVVNQLTASVSIAFIFHLAQRERAPDAAFASLATALFSLALLDLWIGYSQYLIAWYGNLPEAVLFYQSRFATAPWLLEAAGLAQAAGALILLFRRTRRSMLIAAAVLLSAYLAQATWLAGDQAPRGGGAWLVAALLAALWAAWLWVLSRWVDARAANITAGRSAPAPLST